MSQLPPLKQHPHIYGGVLELIHDTPLVLLKFRDEKPRAKLWGKLESVNPGGSVKDRICLAMIERAEAMGLLEPGGIVVEPTSGNTGIGLALVCKRRGYRCILTMPESMSLERRALLELMGAELVLTPAEEQMHGAIRKAEEIVAKEGGFSPHQFANPANPAVHSEHTAREILHAMGDLTLDAFVAGVGTGGTISGVGSVLRDTRPGCRIVAVEPESCATISRGEVGPTKIQGWAAGFVPDNYSASVVHEVRTVSDLDAYRTKRALARDLGMLVGISSGGAVKVALDVARGLSPEQNVVVILPDTGERYFSLDVYFAQEA
ncbi:MAG TPA: cysteine synthase A [Polyangiaceae bacterium]|jgi:cysteine synthase A|nr:cysteine synthase A [Polyangiaceae bacterium]